MFDSKFLRFMVSCSLLACVAASAAPADKDPYATYSFGGSCPSQGAWTQMALAQTKSIYSVIERLKDNPDCKGIGNIAKNLGTAMTELDLKGADEGQSATVESLPSEIDALRRVLMTQGGRSSSAQTLLYKKTIQAASLGGEAAANATVPIDATTAIKSLFTRTSRATNYGLNAVQQVFTALPAYQQCLIGHPDEGMLLLSAAVKVGAAFATSGGGVGQTLGTSIASFVQMMREKKFTLAMRKQNETEFWFSISCLLETTTKNYCEEQNAQELLAYAQKEYLEGAKTGNVGAVDPSADNPLEGYYLLVRELPLVAQWLRGVKLGTNPKLTSDANFQVLAIERVNEMWKLDKVIRSTFSQEMDVYRSMPDVKSKRNKLFDLIVTIETAMRTGKATVEFFTNSMSLPLIPFFLIGMDVVPKEVAANSEGKIQMSWGDWMQTGGDNGGYQAMFENPDELAEVVRIQMDKMIDSANQKAGIFFRQRLVIDLLSLVNRSLVGQNLTVRQSLKHIDRYLGRFEGRLTGSYSDSVMYGTVIETRSRIQAVLHSFDDLAALGKNAKESHIENYSVEERLALTKAAQVVIDSVFQELNVLYMSDVFVTNRVTPFIERDFAIRIKQGENMTPYQKQLLQITQDQLIERMTQLYGVDPVAKKDDLMGAHVINVRNLGAVEDIFKDSVYMMLEELNEVVHGRSADPETMRKVTAARFAKERDIYRATHMVPNVGPMAPAGNVLLNLWTYFSAGHYVKKGHEDLYIRPKSPTSVGSQEDENGSFAQFRGRICAQTLAFQDRERFTALCKGAVVKSFYSEKGEHSPLDLAYDEYMKPGYNKVIMKDPLLVRKRVCAVNDYSIRNWVRFLETRDRRMDESTDE